MSVGAFFDKIFYLGMGIYLIYLSINKKEKLGNKAALVRLGGIFFIASGVIGLIIALIKK